MEVCVPNILSAKPVHLKALDTIIAEQRLDDVVNVVIAVLRIRGLQRFTRHHQQCDAQRVALGPERDSLLPFGCCLQELETPICRHCTEIRPKIGNIGRK